MTPDESLLTTAEDALSRGDAAGALDAVTRLLAADPRNVDAMRLRYRIERERGRLREARAILGQVVSIDPHAHWAWTDLIRLLFEAGRADEAERVGRIALRMNPANAEAHDLFGTLLSHRNELPAGEWHFRRSLDLAGAPRVRANLALNLMQQGRADEAEACYREANEALPDDLRILAHWSKLAEVRGDVPRALFLLDRAAAIGSESDVNLLRARVLARAGRHREALAILERCETMNGDGHLERGRLYDRLGQHERAWEDFVQGKRKLAAEGGNLEYRGEAVDAFFGGLERFFTGRNVELLPAAMVREDVPQPIFVTGFPRSGTTLVEQILSSHPDVRAGGELPFIGSLRELANRLFPDDGPFPENLSRTWTADGHYVAPLFRDYYLARAAQAGLLEPGRRLFVDKMPFNEVWLPLIRMAFPRAPIIRVLRHPLDVTVSMMANHFTHGFHCGYRLADIAAHLAAVSRLTAHYGRELASRELVLRYEDLLADQEGVTRGLLDAAGLPFDDACLRFFDNPRYPATPSYERVTERLNDRSRGRHRHYAAQLEEVVPLLGPVMTGQGYEPL